MSVRYPSVAGADLDIVWQVEVHHAGIQWRFLKARSLIQGVPLAIVRDGELVGKAATQHRLLIDDLCAFPRRLI